MMTEVCECVYTGAMYTFVYKSNRRGERETANFFFFFFFDLFFLSFSLSLSRLLSSLIQPAVSKPPFSFYSVLSPSSFFLGLFFRLFFIVLLFLPKLSMPYIQSNHFGSLFSPSCHQTYFAYIIDNCFRSLSDHVRPTCIRFNTAANKCMPYIFHNDYIFNKFNQK